LLDKHGFITLLASLDCKDHDKRAVAEWIFTFIEANSDKSRCYPL